MTDLDERLQAHFDDARRAELPPGGFDRLTTRLRQPPRRSARPFVALAAALVVAVGVATLVVASRQDENQTVRSTNDPESTVTTATTTPTTPSDPATVPTATTSPAVDDGPAMIAALVDPDGDGWGDVVLLSATTGTVARTIYTAPPPPTGPGEIPTGAVDVDITPAGIVYYEVNRESAVRAVHGYDLNTSEDLGLITYGSSPVASPDGTQLAVYNYPELRVEVVDIDSGDRVDSWLIPDAAGAYVTELAWSPDGLTIAAELWGVRSPVVGVSLLDTSTGTWTPVRTGDENVAMPAFRADGTLLVASPAHHTGDGGLEGGRVVVWDPSTRQVDGSVHIDQVASIDASADGGWAIAARYGAPPHRIGGATGIGDLGPLDAAPEGVIVVAW